MTHRAAACPRVAWVGSPPHARVGSSDGEAAEDPVAAWRWGAALEYLQERGWEVRPWTRRGTEGACGLLQTLARDGGVWLGSCLLINDGGAASLDGLRQAASGSAAGVAAFALHSQRDDEPSGTPAEPLWRVLAAPIAVAEGSSVAAGMAAAAAVMITSRAEPSVDDTIALLLSSADADIARLDAAARGGPVRLHEVCGWDPRAVAAAALGMVSHDGGGEAAAADEADGAFPLVTLRREDAAACRAVLRKFVTWATMEASNTPRNIMESAVPPAPSKKVEAPLLHSPLLHPPLLHASAGAVVSPSEQLTLSQGQTDAESETPTPVHSTHWSTGPWRETADANTAWIPTPVGESAKEPASRSASNEQQELKDHWELLPRALLAWIQAEATRAAQAARDQARPAAIETVPLRQTSHSAAVTWLVIAFTVLTVFLVMVLTRRVH